MQLLTVLSLLTSSIKAQTYVSGGIYSDTTWTKVKSPYILTANVVVFPNVTLTIEPGVVVKFDSAVSLEIRQANIIAIGTKTDSIIFTSDSITPSAGDWKEIFLNGNQSYNKHIFNYCDFRYASNGINKASVITYDTLIIKNSNFNYNIEGIYGGNGASVFIDSCSFRYNTNSGYNSLGQSTKKGVLNFCKFSHNSVGFQAAHDHTLVNCIIDSNDLGVFPLSCKLINCIISHNTVGVFSGGGSTITTCRIDSNVTIGVKLQGGGTDSIFGCQIRYNSTGVFEQGWNHANIITKCIITDNDTGLHIEGIFDKVYCNRICNNGFYNLSYNGNPNISFVGNYWCSNDSATIRSHIYDGYTNINIGLVYITPFDTAGCYSNVGVLYYEPESNSVNIFPNPSSDYLSFTSPFNGEVRIFNLLGELEVKLKLQNGEASINISKLTDSVYILEMSDGNKISRRKFTKVTNSR
jgi:hypothetical protein